MRGNFEPWVGDRYWKEGYRGLRVLALGESHYDTPGTETREYTIEVVRICGQQRRHRFFTGAQKLIAGIEAGVWVSDDERKNFWDAIAFCNYIQFFVGETSRIRPAAQHWQDSEQAFLHNLKILKPHLLVILGLELSNNLPRIPTDITSCVVQHPSSGVSYSKYKPVVEAAFHAAAKRT